MKKLIRKIFKINILMIAIMFMLAGCSNGTAKINGDIDSGDKIKVVTTIFAAYDFTRQIANENADLTLLLPPGTEAHSYEPSPQDIIKIQNCDVFIYNGGESEEWVTDILDNINNPDIKVVKMMDCVNVLEEEVVDGMEAESDEHGNSDEHEDKSDFDEHIWTSPKNAIKIVNSISSALCEKDAKNGEQYKEKTSEYVSQLELLDKQFEEVVNNADRKTVIFGDRFPLRYFVDAYELQYFAAFPGCSTDTEPSAATVAFLIDKVKAEQIPVVFCIELSNGKMADTICEATGAKKLTFNACHNISKSDFQDGMTYLDMMKENVSSLEEALN